MRRLIGASLAMVASTALTGCLATQSQLKHASDNQSVALAQANAALTGERAERAASDSALAQQLGVVRGDVQALRTDITAMRSEFGAKITAMEDGLHFALPVTFDFNAAAIRETNQPALARFAHIAQSYYAGSKITVEGFADPAGTTKYNAALSKRRADAVRQYLVAQGLSDVSAVGYGESRLVTPGASGDQPGAELNRRVVFVIESAGQRTVASAASAASAAPQNDRD
jgi:outer membrane protein OmpA-like peptidoglycan-associated protein